MSSSTGSPYVVAYPDRLAASPGERVSLMASADSARTVAAALVRLGTGAASDGRRETEVRSLGKVEVRPQETQCGSFMVAPGCARTWEPGPFVASVLVSPWRVGRRQVLLGQSAGVGSWSLELAEDGRPQVVVVVGGAARAAVGDRTLVEGAWYVVAGGLDPASGLRVTARPLPFSASWRSADDSWVVSWSGASEDGDGVCAIAGMLDAPVVVAARGEPGGRYVDCFDGKLEAPQLVEGVLTPALVDELTGGRLVSQGLRCGWDFSQRLSRHGASGRSVPDQGAGGADGVLWNTPTEAVTGHLWDGSEQDFRLAPHHYAAVHFHSDDLDDCGWIPVLEVDLPPELPSGAYAVRLHDDVVADRAPFFVRASAPTAPLVFLAPTASYLAYANDHPVSDGAFSEATAARTPVVYEDDLLLHEHREWGLSCYDGHVDGSGVGVSSARRPLVNMRPTHRYHVGPWQFPADLAVLGWLGDEGFAYDVVTDEDLHRDGARVLAPYRAVLSGTHPEYYSTAMLDGLERYLDDGGRLISIGANGYYWRVAFDSERPWVMELRRAYSGSRAWESAPGEAHLAFSGELGGLWRHLGRPPQRMAGVGYAAQGFDRSGWYRRLSDSDDPRVAFAFEGVNQRVFGTAGAIGGGAVGQEIDRFDPVLGSPHDALLLATSEGLSEGFLRCAEEVSFTLPGTSALFDPQVRADVVYVVKRSGGAVFSTGSIAWAGALGVDPALTRVTRNVVARFCDPAPLPW
ncbi:MAG TPA: N,N-dimethylformamidase beta subunit family domain-containing protein [Acidimicrobiales bacterium]|nr:N,N-dimethylformamidase beta subunit family domain-containing protein [Acidimicrobiales bacterium]